MVECVPAYPCTGDSLAVAVHTQTYIYIFSDKPRTESNAVGSDGTACFLCMVSAVRSMSSCKGNVV